MKCYCSTLHELPPLPPFARRFVSRRIMARSLRKLWTGQIAVSLRVAVEGFARRKARGQDALPRSSFREFKGWRVRGMHGGPRRCRTLRKDPRAAARTTSPVPFIPSSAAEAVLTQVARTATVRQLQRLECCSAASWEGISFCVCSPFLSAFAALVFLLSILLRGVDSSPSGLLGPEEEEPRIPNCSPNEENGLWIKGGGGLCALCGRKEAGGERAGECGGGLGEGVGE